MAHQSTKRHVTDDERREFLKALGVGGAVAAGSATLGEVREVLATGTGAELAPIGREIQADLSGTLDAGLLASQQEAVATHASALSTVAERGLPEEGPREEFATIATAARPVYEHLTEAGFFESTTNHLPELTPEYLETSAEAFVNSAPLAAPLDELGFTGEEGVDLLATVIANAEEIDDYHWVATDQIPREQIEIGEHIPAMTRAVAGGAVLWLEDLDTHLAQKRVLLTDEILDAAVWHARSMVVGFNLMTEGARAIAEDAGSFSESELGALLSTGFAVQAIAQHLLPKEVYWITEDMRADSRTDLNTITE